MLVKNTTVDINKEKIELGQYLLDQFLDLNKKNKDMVAFTTVYGPANIFQGKEIVP